MAKNIESKVADTILERTHEVTIGENKYNAAQPTTATLIAVSEYVAQLPQVKLDSNDILSESLRVAKDCRVLGDIVAVLILGEGNNRQPATRKKNRFLSFFDKTENDTKQTVLAKEILTTLSPRQLNQVVIDLLKRMEIADFFGLTTSLIEVNLTAATKMEVVEKTTASGQ